MNIAQRTAPQQPSSSWGSTTNDEVAYKFQSYDKNKDGILDKVEFRALLKDVFSSQTSTQFLDDAIEETVWRESNVDLLKAKQAINSIKETFSISTPYSLSKTSYPQTSIRDHPIISEKQSYNSQGQVATSTEPIKAIPPPPQFGRHNLGGKPSAPPLPPRSSSTSTSTSTSTSQAHETTTTNPFLAKPPSGMPASNPFFAEETSTMPTALEKGPAPVRVLPMLSNAGQSSLSSASQASKDERRAFVEYINTNVALKNDPDVSGVIPITVDQIYDVVSQGWLFCKLLNTIQPDVVPPAKIKLHPKNAFEKIENHTLAIGAAKKLGCSVINIGPEDLLKGTPRLVLGLLWQIIKKDVLSKVSLAQHPEIYKLAKGGTTLKDITECSPEEVLLKWANHHLQNAKPGAAITNFSQDLKDGSAYTLLMNQVAPQVCSTDALRESDPTRRAQMIVENAKKLNCDRFVTPEDIVNGNTKLNLAFMADLFNKHSGLELPTLEEMEKLKKQNASLSGILDEAEARLRQILADGRLAYELQQEEILLYRQRKLKEQEELAEQEAMLRAQLAQEEMMLTQQKRMKELALEEQEQFAREEQRKEELRASSKHSASSSHSSSSSRTASSSSSSSSSGSARASSSRTTNPSNAASYSSSYSSHSSSSSSSSPPSYYSSTSSHAPSYSAHSSSSSSHAPAAASYSAHSTPASSAYDSYSYSSSSYSATPQHYSASYSSTAPSYATAFAPHPPPAPHAAGYAAPAANPYNVYPPQPSYAPPTTETYGTTTQTVYTEPPPVADYILTNDSPVSVRKRGVFERVGKKIDRAFH